MKHIKAFENHSQHPELLEFSRKLRKFIKEIGSDYKVIFHEENDNDHAAIDLENEENISFFVDENSCIKIYINHNTEDKNNPIMNYIVDLCKIKNVRYDISIKINHHEDLYNINLNKDEYELWLNIKKYNL